MPASSMSPCNVPGGIAETRSGNISRRKENCIEKKEDLQNLHNTIVKHYNNTKREEAAKEILSRVSAFETLNEVPTPSSKMKTNSVKTIYRSAQPEEFSPAS